MKKNHYNSLDPPQRRNFAENTKQNLLLKLQSNALTNIRICKESKFIGKYFIEKA